MLIYKMDVLVKNRNRKTYDYHLLMTSQNTSIIKKIIAKIFVQKVRSLVLVRSEGYSTDCQDCDLLG